MCRFYCVHKQKHCLFVIAQSSIAPPPKENPPANVWLWRLQNMLTGVALASNLRWPVHIGILILYRSQAVFHDFTEKWRLRNVQCWAAYSNTAVIKPLDVYRYQLWHFNRPNILQGKFDCTQMWTSPKSVVCFRTFNAEQHTPTLLSQQSSPPGITVDQYVQRWSGCLISNTRNTDQ